MNDDAKLTRVDQLFVYGDKSFVCNDQHIFFYGFGGTQVFNLSGKWVKNLGKDPLGMVAVGTEILAGLIGEPTLRVWSTSGDMEQLHDLQLADFGVSCVVVVGKMAEASNAVQNKVIIMTTSSMIVTEMGEDERWKDKILASFPDMYLHVDAYGYSGRPFPRPEVVAGRGDWIATASMDCCYGGCGGYADEITVTLWHEDKRLPDVILDIFSKDSKRLTGISIESTMEGLKLVISLEEERRGIVTGWAMMVYNVVPDKTSEDESINLNLMKSLRSDKAPDQQLSGSRPCWNYCREEEINESMQMDKLISTDLILGHFAPGHPNAVVTL